jgi:hypothetical protein
LRHHIPSRLPQGGRDEFRADIPFAEGVLVHPAGANPLGAHYSPEPKRHAPNAHLGKAQYDGLVALLTWRDLLFCAKHLL